MSTSKALLTISVLAAGPCVATEDPAPGGGDEPAIDVLYDCAHVFDPNCRFEAEVTIDGGSLSFEESGNSLYSLNETIIEAATGTVVLRDGDGEYEAVACHFTLDTDLRIGDDSMVLDVGTTSFIDLDPSCPVTCAWFLPQEGIFHDGAFGTSMAGGDPNAVPEWAMRYANQEWFRTAPIEADVTPQGWPFFENAPLVSSTWTAPVAFSDIESHQVECWGDE